MDWFKWDSDCAGNAKLAQLSDKAFRALVHLCGYAMRHETDGVVPGNVHLLVPRVTPAVLSELERCGFLQPQPEGGWALHDWDHHQADALKIQERRKREAERQRKRRAAASADSTRTDTPDASTDASQDRTRTDTRMRPRSVDVEKEKEKEKERSTRTGRTRTPTPPSPDGGSQTPTRRLSGDAFARRAAELEAQVRKERGL